MSLLVTVYTNTGIVMASDSRTTLSGRRTSIELTDSTDKTHLLINKCGISHCGSADMGEKPISVHIENFQKQFLKKDTPITKVPELLVKYIELVKDRKTDITFIVAGYQEEKDQIVKYVYEVNYDEDGPCIEEHSENECGAIWRGQTDVFSRLRQPVIIRPDIIHEGEATYKDESGKKKVMKNAGVLDMDCEYVNNSYKVDYGYMSVQDAVDFSKYAIETTINTMKYSSVEKTVGGPIDILVIRPNESFWVNKKEVKI